MVWNWYDLRFERFTNPSYLVLILQFDFDESTLVCMIQQWKGGRTAPLYDLILRLERKGGRYRSEILERKGESNLEFWRV